MPFPSSVPAATRRIPARQASRLRAGDGARTLAARLLLALFLVLAQIGGLTHAIGHLADLPDSRQAQTSGLGEDEGPADLSVVCADCLALSGLDLPLGHGPGRAHHPETDFAPLPGAAPAVIPAAALLPPSRAPPLLG